MSVAPPSPPPWLLDLVGAADAYLARGWPVVPVVGKLPPIPWKAFQRRLPTLEEMESWPWNRATGVAIVVGPGLWERHPYLWVLEIEARHRSDAERWLNAELPHWRTAGLVAQSGSGGLHVYCEATRAVRSSTYPWGEIRGAGNIAVLPPSLHPNGRRYEWLSDVEPVLLDPRDVPGVTVREYAPREPVDDRDESDRPDARLIFAACGYLRHVRDDAETILEPEWHAGLSVLALCRGGETLAHKISRPYPAYTPDETQAKFERARVEDKPMTCATIRHDRGGEAWCRHCPLPRWITSPIELGYRQPRLTVGGRLISADTSDERGTVHETSTPPSGHRTPDSAGTADFRLVTVRVGR